ncbi:MAG: bis(5'-nucleosyl)-tetraphosphatase (symmetrical) YqeK [Emergencia sp.]
MKLAEKYGADVEKAETAALFHDMFRGVPEDALNYYVKHLDLDRKYMNNCNLAHGKIAAVIMKRDYGIEDEDILNAVSYHTTGRPGMSLLEKIIYIADAIEPARNYPGVASLREAAWRDLDEACLLSLTRTIDYVTGQGNYLDTDTLDARDYFIQQKENLNG